MSDANRAGEAGGKRTLVEEGTQLKGSLSSSCPIDVKGRVEGELTAPSLTVSSTGAVHGKVKVEDLVSEGEISGEVEADVVRLSGVVKDNTVLRAKSLEVKLVSANGKVQVTFGECVLEVGEAPTREVDKDKGGDQAKKEDSVKADTRGEATARGDSKAEAKGEAAKAAASADAPKGGGEANANANANGSRSVPPPKASPSIPPPHLS